MKKSLLILCAGLLSITPVVVGQVNITPLAGFSPNGDGWLAPGEGGYTFLGTGNLERGLAFGNDHLYLVSRNTGNFIRILDKLTGADLGSLNTTGVSGGTFAVNTVAVGGDGAIYVNNLTTQSTTSPLKVYRWANEAAVPTVAYSGDASLAGSRVGDSLAADGGGASTRLAFGYGNNPVVAGNNGYSIVDSTAGTATAIGFTGTPPAAGDFRLGISFAGQGRVLGSQGSSVFRDTSFSGSTGTLLGSGALGSVAERLLAYAVVGGVPLLAVQSTGDSHVSLYDVTDSSNPLFLVSGNATFGTLTANGNGTGQLAWGDITGDTAILYAMSSNQGIQAFTVTVPEPSVIATFLIGTGVIGFNFLRRRRS